MEGSHLYSWTGIDRTGQMINGLIYSNSATHAKLNLHQQGIQTLKIKKKQSLRTYFKRRRIQPSEITAFTRQLANLLQAEVPLVQALALLTTSTDNLRLKKCLHTLQQDTQSGLSLANACRKQSKYFNPLFCYMIHAGELSGALIHLLKQLALYQETRAQLKQKIKKSLAYPLTILCVASIVTLGLLIFVVPQFEALFKSFHASLPPSTQWLIYCAQWIRVHGFIALILISCSLYGLRYFYKKSHSLALKWDTLILRLPFIGQTIQLSILARLTETLSILLSAGLPLVDALSFSAQIAHNLRYTQAILNIKSALTEGHPLQKTLENTGLFPNLFTQMIGIGEATGRLQPMLKQLATQQANTLKHRLDVQSSLFEPILMAILGLWIGGLIITLYLPIFQLGSIFS